MQARASLRIPRVVVPALLSLIAAGCGVRSRLLEATVESRCLIPNEVGVAARQPVRVYLPPSYESSGRRYPVLYFLPGYDDPVWIFTGGGLQGFRLRDSLDRLLSEGRIGEMIVVVPNGTTPLGGTFYTNSPVLGMWENYVCTELVRYVDANFRTRAAPRSRAIAGTTTGASGALLLAMRQPEVFGAVYALDPALIRPGMLESGEIFGTPEAELLLALQDAWELQPKPLARLSLTLHLQHLLGSEAESNHLRAFSVAMAAAFSPEPGRRGLPVRLPYRRSRRGLSADPVAIAALKSGLGDWEEKIGRFGGNLRSLQLLALDYGTETSIRWLPLGCEYLSGELASAGIPHRSIPHPGNHEDRFRERMEQFLLPIVSEVLHAREEQPPPIKGRSGAGV